MLFFIFIYVSYHWLAVAIKTNRYESENLIIVFEFESLSGTESNCHFFKFLKVRRYT